MANTKHSVGREIIIDRLLHKRRGYSLYEMLDIVNQELELSGFKPVTLNTIRNDIDNFRTLYKQKIEVEVRNRKNYYRFEDPESTIFNNVLTYGELRHLHSALICIRYKDVVQGTLMYDQISQRLADILDIDPASDPIVIYDSIPKRNSLKRFQTLYEYIRTKTPCIITVRNDQNGQEDLVIHPYFLHQRDNDWTLLCHDSTNNTSAEIPLTSIIRLATSYEKFIPNKDFPLRNFYMDKLFCCK